MESSENKNKITENIFSNYYNFTTENPFSNDFTINEIHNPVEKEVTSPIKRLNGYDSTILNNTKFDEAETENLSVEYRIKEKESILKELNSKIKIADNYGTQNEALGLKAKRQRIMQELSTLRQQNMYGNRISGEKDFHYTMKEKMPIIYNIQNFVSRYLLAKLSPKIRSIITLSDSLDQLTEISNKVDQLNDINVPYGEKIQNYEKLTEYLNKANIIHANISKSLGKNI